MSSTSVIILTYNGEIHIERCIRSLLPIASNIFVVVSFSKDKTIKFVNQTQQSQ
ncbi:MAG: glycosyltransferase involved in cell wall biosynthesis [Psychroserpens sp.]|jgi:glycosyltransferase involved in cell wall biosynthesis